MGVGGVSGENRRNRGAAGHGACGRGWRWAAFSAGGGGGWCATLRCGEIGHAQVLKVLVPRGWLPAFPDSWLKRVRIAAKPPNPRGAKPFQSKPNVWSRQGWQGSGQGRREAPPQGVARQHPGHHRASMFRDARRAHCSAQPRANCPRIRRAPPARPLAARPLTPASLATSPPPRPPAPRRSPRSAAWRAAAA